jgi:hypothetical protein
MLMVAINSEFDKCGWRLQFQPSNYPLTNIKDYCIFPAMSKAVTAKQGLKNGNLVIDNEELWSYVLAVYKETVARACMSHHRVVNAVADDNGGDAFVREKKALHFGIRQLYVPYYDDEEATEPSGVEMIQSIACEQGVDTSGLRCKSPSLPDSTWPIFSVCRNLEFSRKPQTS